MSASHASEMHMMLSAELKAEERQQGRKQAAAVVARWNGISERRLWGIIRREVGRVWADEMDKARAVYREFLRSQVERLESEAQKLAAERARLDAQDARDGLT